MKNYLLLAALSLPMGLIAQDGSSSENGGEPDKKVLNWYNGTGYGMSTDLAYKKLLAGKKSEPVVVAVIDSGVDLEHIDLKGKIWVNKDEIPDNGIDDDKNGYIDDVNGWSFLGNPDGENLEHEQLEVTRIYARLKPKYDGKTASDAEDKEEFALWEKCKKEVEGTIAEGEKTVGYLTELYEKSLAADKVIRKANGNKDYTVKDLKKMMKDDDKEVANMATLMVTIMGQGLTVSKLERYSKYYKGSLDYHYNPDYDARSIVGDNPADFNDIYYGSKDAEGPDAFHGTHCAGIIGAVRGNGIGNDGVADNVQIMSIRAVPDGDERDKDVALAIRYAVDNGAQVCNMSFGKSFSAYPEEVQKAIKYAEEKGVLLVHAAGNDSKDTEVNDNFPSPQYDGQAERYKNWIEVGASTRYGSAVNNPKKPAKNHDGLSASFSNYSDKVVDIFAPGLEIYSTVPQSDWDNAQGTSMAAPMVAGVAALLKSYYPELTMFQIKDIILESGQDCGEIETPLPGTADKMVKFKTLSRTGKVANVYNAVEMAEKMTSGGTASK